MAHPPPTTSASINQSPVTATTSAATTISRPPLPAAATTTPRPPLPLSPSSDLLVLQSGPILADPPHDDSPPYTIFQKLCAAGLLSVGTKRLWHLGPGRTEIWGDIVCVDHRHDPPQVHTPVARTPHTHAHTLVSYDPHTREPSSLADP